MILPYRWFLSERADKDFEKLPTEIVQRIIEKLELSREDSFRFFVRLKGRAEFKLRTGDYRVIADIDTKEFTIKVNKAGHRRNIYQ